MNRIVPQNKYVSLSNNLENKKFKSSQGKKVIPKLIGKSKILRGYQCPKAFYLSLFCKELEPPMTEELRFLFKEVESVQIEARKLFLKNRPSLVIVDVPAWDFVGALKKTKEFLNLRQPVILDAAFEYKGCFTRIDQIIFSEDTQRWIISEVKASSQIKKEHLDDLALQVWIIVNAGLPIEKINLLHLDRTSEYPDKTDLFIQTDVTVQIREKYSEIPDRLNQLFSVLKKDEPPVESIGAHCFSPNPCVFFNYCKHLSAIAMPSVFDIPTLYEKKWDFYKSGVIDLNDERLDLPESLTPQQKIFRDVLRTKNRFVNVFEIQKALQDWTFPLAFLDFETINYMVPQFSGVRPFQQVPFQWSLHFSKTNFFQAPDHFEYLHSEKGDPRRPLVEKLIDVFKMRPKGSIVAYYSKFEADCLEDLAYFFPEYRAELLSLKDRLVDPLPLFREFVYDEKFKDSFSLKSVAPAILGDSASYQGLSIGDGKAAQRGYLKLISMSVAEPSRGVLEEDLLMYCKKDTQVLVDLVRWLYSVR